MDAHEASEPESSIPTNPPLRGPRTRGSSSTRLHRPIASSSRLEAQKPTVLDLSDSEQEDPSEEFSAYTNRPTGVTPVAIGTLKRGPPELATPERLERPKARLSRVLRPTQQTQPNQPTQDYTQPTQSPTKEAIRQARDLIIKALSLTESYEEQSRLLDLIEVFREYTEKGRL